MQWFEDTRVITFEQTSILPSREAGRLADNHLTDQVSSVLLLGSACAATWL